VALGGLATASDLSDPLSGAHGSAAENERDERHGTVERNPDDQPIDA